MSKITVGLSEHGQVNGKYTAIHPPGGESSIMWMMEDVEEASPIKATKVLQPPGGHTTDFLSSSETSSEAGSDVGERAEIMKINHDRMKSSFVLGYEPADKPIVVKRKKAVPVSPVAVDLALAETSAAVAAVVADVAVLSVEVAVTPPAPAKPNRRIPPGGHCTKLW